MTIVDTPRLRFYVEEMGGGAPVLFINGTGGDLRVKPSVMDGPLPSHRHVIAYDQRGLGQTEKPEGPYTMADYGDDAAELLTTMGHDQVGIVVKSSAAWWHNTWPSDIPIELLNLSFAALHLVATCQVIHFMNCHMA